MLRAVKFILLAAVLLVLAWWIGGLPGDVTAHAGRYTVETSTPAALLILLERSMRTMNRARPVSKTRP